MTAQVQDVFVPVEDLLDSLLPSNVVQFVQTDALASVWMQPLNVQTDPSLTVATALLFETSLEIGIPGLDAVSVVIAPDGNETVFMLQAAAQPIPSLSLVDVPIALRFGPDLLKPARKAAAQDNGGDTWEVDPTVDHVDITLAKVTLSGDVDGNFSVKTDLSIDMPPAMIGDTGVVIEARDIGIYLDANNPPPGKPAGWRGVYIGSASVHLPGGLSGTIGTLSMTSCYIGNGGFSGTVSDTWTPPIATSIFGMDCALESVEITFVQNALTAASIAGSLTLPFFDHAVDVQIGFGLNGTFIISLRDPSGIVTLTKDGLFSLAVDGLSFAESGGVFTVGVSGTLTPLIGGLDWPGITLKKLTIDSKGNVHIDGGWLSLPSQYHLDFFGFHVGITKLGMGSTKDGGRWIGFSGSIKLVDGLGIGGSVDGLRITWYSDGREPKLTLDGVGVELDIPDVLRFKGSVDYHELTGPPAGHQFDGSITLELLALDLRVDGQIVIGQQTDPATGNPFTYFALYLGTELPAGIPLWSTGLALYGIDGLIAIEMAPNKGLAPNQGEEWYENADGSPGWYKRTPAGVTPVPLTAKWAAQPGGFALGGGITIGTLPDNGFTFNGRVLLVISFPGPVILLEGKANLLKERAALTDASDPVFRALAVLDFKSDDFLVGIDARYKYGDGGELIDIGGSAEAYFDFNDGSKWHLYIGQKDPKTRRIHAQILKIFEADAYFMLNADQLAMGAWIGWDANWSFGPVSLIAQAWIQGDTVVSWKPAHFSGSLWLHGKVALTVFGIGFGLSLDAMFAADVFDPFHLLADLTVGVILPWPLPNFSFDLTLEWGPTKDQPPIPLPLKEVAIEHFKSTASWPLPRTSLLLPNLDRGDGFLPGTIPPAPLDAPPPAGVPVVPLDARPHITFGRAVNDDALVGVNPQPQWPAPPASLAGYEQIGDPSKNQGPLKVRYAVEEITLSRWTGSAWADVARKAAKTLPQNDIGVAELWGSWAPVPQLPAGTTAPGTAPASAQTKLWLWSDTPFDYTLHGGQTWDDWFSRAYPDYPCLPPVGQRTVCVAFDSLPAGTVLNLPAGPFEDHPEITLAGPVSPAIVALPAPVAGHGNALCFDPGTAPLTLSLGGDPASQVVLTFADPAPVRQITLVDVGSVTGTEVSLPYQWQSVTLSMTDQTGSPLTNVLLLNAGRRGFNILFQATVDLPLPASWASVTLIRQGGAVTVNALNGEGAELDTVEVPPGNGTVELVVTGAGISRLVITAPAPDGDTLLAQVCYARTVHGALSVQATGVDANGASLGSFPPDVDTGNTITVSVPGLTAVQLTGSGQACLVQACVTYPPDPAQVAVQGDMTEHITDSLMLLTQQGAVLDPDTSYRLKIVTSYTTLAEGQTTPASGPDLTEVAYFATQGPPALTQLSTPVNQGANFDSGLDDLTRYVAQTVPATVPARGEQPPLPRPVYRAYDVGAVFNEDYVDLMYRLATRDLFLYLFDPNNQPVRDAAGRLIVTANRWGVNGSLTLTDSTKRYVTLINQSTCATINPAVIAHTGTVTAADQDQVLAPDAVYQARLIPLLRHDDFRDGLASWTVVDSGTTGGPSAWATVGHPTLSGTGATASGATVTLTGAGDLSRLDPAIDVVLLNSDLGRVSKTYRVVSVNNATKQVTLDAAPAIFFGSSPWQVPGWGAATQASGIWGGSQAAADAAKPGTMLISGQPAWTDYRFTVELRSSDPDAIGVVFRYQGPGDHYRYSMDATRRYRRLVRFTGGACTVLAEDDAGYDLDRDYTVTVEAIGGQLAVYQDGALVFAVTDTTIATGQVGLYCWANPGARFADVRVDDFSKAAPVAYRFSFTTSTYATFAHQLHSYQDETWVTEAVTADLSAEAADAVALSAAVSDAETRAFSSFAGKVLGPADAAAAPASLEVHRVTVGGEPAALLVRGPEPIDWARTELTVSAAPPAAGIPATPGVAKLTQIATGGTSPDDESVTLIARDSTSLAGVSVAAYDVPGPLPDDDQVLLDDSFTTPAGLLFEERFGVNALDSYRIVDAPGAVSGPSQWAVASGAIVQTSGILTSPADDSAPAQQGTVAVTGDRWGNIRLTAMASSSDGSAFGVVFRYADDANWYRFSMDANLSYRRLVKSVGGTVTVLWEDHAVYNLAQAFQIRIDAFGDLLLGYLDGSLLFAVRDAGIQVGQVGLYTWNEPGCTFSELTVTTLDASPLLFQAAFTDPAELSIVDTGTVNGPSAWTVGSGQVAQTSAISDTGQVPLAAGTVALLAPELADLALSLTLRSGSVGGTGGSIGVVFRYADDANWYRFSMDRTASYRRLVKSVGGTVTVLWQDGVAYNEDHDYALTLIADGPRLTASLDGAMLFDLTDTDLTSGRTGLYSHANTNANFTGLAVTVPSRFAGPWQIVDDTPAASVWRVTSGTLRQLSSTASTTAVRGSAGWTDYRLAATASSQTPGAIGIVLRRTDRENCYQLVVDTQAGTRSLIRRTAGVATVLWQDTQAPPAGQPLELAVDAMGGRLVGYAGGQVLFDLADTDHPAGQIGLLCSANPGATFERVTVTTPPLDAYAIFRDTPGDLSPWTIVDEGTLNGPSAWAATGAEVVQSSGIASQPADPASVDKRGTLAVAGDPAWGDVVAAARLESTAPGAIGLVFRYTDDNNFYRFSMDNQGGYRRLVRCAAGVFTTLWQDATAYQVGQPYDLVVAATASRLAGWLDGVPVFDVTDVALPAGQIGLYCWNDPGAHFSQVRVFPASQLATDSLLDEDFVVETFGRWTFQTAGDQNGPAAWQFTGGELQQTSGVWGGSLTADELAKPGTLALTGDSTWTDYRVTVGLRSDDPDAIGVVFRYVDDANWYRFSMDANLSYRRLVKSVGGTVTVLWQDNIAYQTGTRYLLTIEAVGDALAGYLDGVLLFSVRDPGIPAGGIGLYCWHNPAARFSAARVSAAIWTGYYQFGAGEQPLPAGTLVTVHSGNASDWTTPPRPGLTDRFLATLRDPGHQRLSLIRPANLRVTAADGTSGHSRRFLPAAEYTAVPATVLRSADGTGFVLFPPGAAAALGATPPATPPAAALPQAVYRLALTYHRDNTAASPGSPVLTQAGDATDETVLLDIPWDSSSTGN